MRKIPAASLLLIALAFPLSGQQIRFLYMKQSGYDLGDIVERAESFHQATGIRVSPVFVEYEDRYNLILESAARTVPDLDVILVDLIWVADFAEKGIIDPLPQGVDKQVRDGIVPQIYSAFTWRDRLWAVPFPHRLPDALHEHGRHETHRRARPAANAEELVRLAHRAKAAGVVKYPFFDSWRQQEVLTCEFTWLVGAFGGSLVDGAGRIHCDSPPALRALGFMIGLLGEGLASPYSLESEENFVSEVFLAGDCMFTTNWGFQIRLLMKNDQPGVKDWRVSPIPVSQSVSRDGKATSSICGFEGLTVLSGSAHKAAAWKFAQYLASLSSSPGTWSSCRCGKKSGAGRKRRGRTPSCPSSRRQIAGLQYRPVHPRYRQISAILQHWISRPCSGQVPAAEALREAQTQIDRVTGTAP